MYIYPLIYSDFMNTVLKTSLVKTVLEDSDFFMAVYDVRNKAFLYINFVGLNKLKVGDLSEFSLKYPHGFRKTKLTTQDHIELEKHLEKEGVLQDEVLFQTFDQTEFWGELQIKLFYHESVPYYYIKIVDTTLIKQKEQKIIDEENRFEALFMHAAIGIVVVNKESEIVMSNQFADMLFGYEKGEMIGQKLDILIPQNLKEKHHKTYENYTEKPQARSMGLGLNLNGRKKDGSLFSVEISLSHFKLGEKPFYISFINDTTFKRKAEEELIIRKSEIEMLNGNLEKEVINRTNALVETLKRLEKSKKDLELALEKEKELGDLKSRFVSMASHEFRTPLTTIQSAAYLIEKYQKTEEQEKRERHTKKITAAVGNLTDILEEFLSVGKLEEGKIVANYSDFEMEELIKECIFDLKSVTKAGQKITYSHFGKSIVHLDKSLFRKIVINLCSNALKFSPLNSEIQVRTENNDNRILLEITDKGIGIAKEDQKNLFDRFFRGKNVTNIQGTGLGLHIVARYVALMKGQVSVKSKLNEGTAITIKI